VLECEQLCADAHCHGGALRVYRMSAFHAFCSEWLNVVISGFRNTLLTLLWFLVP
jgi:hypothetical protein